MNVCYLLRSVDRGYGRRRPKGFIGAYREIERVLARFSFERIQSSLCVTRKEDLANLFFTNAALKALPWFPQSVRDIRAFRIDLWSDMTAFAKG